MADAVTNVEDLKDLKKMGAARGDRACGRPGLQLRCARAAPCLQLAQIGPEQCLHAPWARGRAWHRQGGVAAAVWGACA